LGAPGAVFREVGLGVERMGTEEGRNRLPQEVTEAQPPPLADLSTSLFPPGEGVVVRLSLLYAAYPRGRGRLNLLRC
jgi:hypothetical protein